MCMCVRVCLSACPCLHVVVELAQGSLRRIVQANEDIGKVAKGSLTVLCTSPALLTSTAHLADRMVWILPGFLCRQSSTLPLRYVSPTNVVPPLLHSASCGDVCRVIDEERHGGGQGTRFQAADGFRLVGLFPHSPLSSKTQFRDDGIPRPPPPPTWFPPPRAHPLACRKSVVMSNATLDYLKDLVAKVPDAPAAKRRQSRSVMHICLFVCVGVCAFVHLHTLVV